MFKFNFNSNDTDENVESKKCESEGKEENWTPSQRQIINQDHLDSIDQYKIVDSIELDEFVLYIVSLEEIKSRLSTLEKEKDVESMLAYNDLTPSIYEGGFKIWECTWDVLNYIQEKKLILKDKRLLDLGCGGGLIGIYSMLKGAHVTMQDYNSHVLDLFTIPNLLINLKHCTDSSNKEDSDCEEDSGDKDNSVIEYLSQIPFKCDSLNKILQFYLGDWKGLAEVILDNQSDDLSPSIDKLCKETEVNGVESRNKKFKNSDDGEKNIEINEELFKFDIITTSETIYNTNNYGKLLETVARTLKKDGTILVAAKVHYFGVGGSTYEFKNFVTEDGRFTINTYPINNEGVGREILVMKFKETAKL